MTVAAASKLQEHIKMGDPNGVKSLLSSYTSCEAIRELENIFIETDPVNLAINCREQEIAIYLVEKGFSVSRTYKSPSKRCDQWCNSKHGQQKCPADYDAADNAASKKFYRLKELIDNIRAGRRRPGEGIVDATTAATSLDNEPHPPPVAKPQFQRTLLPPTKKEKPKSAANEAAVLLGNYGNKFTTKDGSTLLHRVATSTPAHVYVMANNGVPVNVQNSNGDTALHLAVKTDKFDVCEALIQCCADLTLRNKMGQTPLDIAQGPIADLLQKADPDPIKALQHGDAGTLIKHFRKNWCNMNCIIKPGVVGALTCGRPKLFHRLLHFSGCLFNTIVKDGMNLVELAMTLNEEDPKILNCCRILHEFRETSELIHAVLAEDMEKLHFVLSHSRGISVNLRFRDRYGKTLLSHAIHSNNLEVVKILVEAGARVNGVRVRDAERSNETVPLFHKALQKHVAPEIPHYIHSVQQASEMIEKDHNGNTALLRAVEEGASDRIIDWLLVSDSGLSLTHRNKHGMNARELAVSKGRSDIVQIIDKYVLQQRGKFFLVNLPVHFYGLDNLQFTDEQLGKTLLEVVEEGKDRDDIKALRYYSEIEERGILLFQASAAGDLKSAMKHNVANFQDKNGYTALIRAIVFNQVEIAKYLCVSRPVLKSMPDNSNRYPLHYACALPEAEGKQFISILLERKAEDIDKKMDENGLFPAEYIQKRTEPWVVQMLNDAKMLDAYGREGPEFGAMNGQAIESPS